MLQVQFQSSKQQQIRQARRCSSYQLRPDELVSRNVRLHESSSVTPRTLGLLIDSTPAKVERLGVA